MISMLIKLAAVLTLGFAPVSVLPFEVLLHATSMFKNGNVRLAARLNRALRRYAVTPDMHRVHHSIDRHETDSNFGFNLPWWDHMFRTYRDQPAFGHDRTSVSIGRFRVPCELWLDRMLSQPLRREAPTLGRSPVSP